MDLIIFWLEHVAYFCVASTPLIVVFLQLKAFNNSLKSVVYTLVLNLLVSVFFWIKLKDGYLALYQSVPYISSFIWVWCENILIKRHKENSTD